MSNRQGLSLVLAIVLFAVGSMAVAAEEGTVKAIAAWKGKGRFFRVQEKLVLFAGAFEGVMFLDNKGSLNLATLVCPGMLEINMDDGGQSGSGRCLIKGGNGDRVYATWNCAGEHGDGCTGTFTLHGGTGKFQGISGNSNFEVRSDMLTYVKNQSEDSVEGEASGVATWPTLTYKIP